MQVNHFLLFDQNCQPENYQTLAIHFFKALYLQRNLT
jgi:hypothetical protein